MTDSFKALEAFNVEICAASGAGHGLDTSNESSQSYLRELARRAIEARPLLAACEGQTSGTRGAYVYGIACALDRALEAFPPQWRAEFPDYPAAAIPVLGEGWSDISWHNDVCPSFVHDESGVLLWADYPDAAQRENSRNPHFMFEQMERDGDQWAHGDPAPFLLQCDTIGEVRDLLDSIPYLASMADALRSARMRLNQLTADDARAFLAQELEHDLAGGRACPDLICGMRSILAKAPGAMTLDGFDARIRFAGKFGFVRRADDKGGEVEFSIAACARVLANGGEFQS